MKKLMALLLSVFCLVSVAACVQDGTDNSSSVNTSSVATESDEESSSTIVEEEKTEFQKIREYLNNTSNAKNSSLIYEIAMAHQSIEIKGDVSLADRSYNSETGEPLDAYEKCDSVVEGKITRLGEGDSPYKADIFAEGKSLYADESGLYYDDTGLEEFGYYGMKYNSMSIDAVLSIFQNTWCANAKETFAMNAQYSEDILAQIGTTYSMETVGDITVITYSAESAEMTMENIEITDSARLTLTWKFDKNYRCIEFLQTYTSTYKAEVAASAGRTNGSESYSVKAWDGTVNTPTNLDKYMDMGTDLFE